MCIKDIETSHYAFCKYVLGIPRHAENLYSIGELGRSNLYCFALHRKVKFWLRVLSHFENRYSANCYKHLLNLADPDSWVCQVKLILATVGFGDIWINQGVHGGNENGFLNCFLQRLVDINKQNWLSGISDLARVPLYKNFKKANYFETYLSKINYRSYQVLFTKLRCGLLDLTIHSGRINKVQRHNRLCTFCNLGQIEDEFHFLFICPIYAELRNLYIPKLFTRNPTVVRFCSFLKTDNPLVLKHICIFVEKALEMRSYLASCFDEDL